MPGTPATYHQRRDARAGDRTPPPAHPGRRHRPGPILRVHVEEIPESRARPELLSSPPGRAVFDAVGPREVVACALRRLARRFDPPWWMFWARLRR